MNTSIESSSKLNVPEGFFIAENNPKLILKTNESNLKLNRRTTILLDKDIANKIKIKKIKKKKKKKDKEAVESENKDG